VLFGLAQRFALPVPDRLELPAPESERDFELMIRKPRLCCNQVVQRGRGGDALGELGVLGDRLADCLELPRAQPLRFAQHRSSEPDEALQSGAVRIKELLLLGRHEEPPGVSKCGAFNIRRRMPREQGLRTVLKQGQWARS